MNILNENTNINTHTDLLKTKDLLNKRNIVVNPLKTGLKTKFPLNTAEEQQCVQNLLNDLRHMISAERIEKASNRSRALIQSNRQILVERIVGKWNNIGFTVFGRNYLHTHEALYLLEMNRLELYYNSMIVSLEQAYSLLLNCNNCLNMEEYIVYREFNRLGYNCQLHQSTLDHFSVNSEYCVWKCLKDLLNNKLPPDDNSEYAKTMKSMNDFSEMIKSQNYPNRVIESRKMLPFSLDWNKKIASKSSRTSSVRKKRQYREDTTKFLDALIDENDVKMFQPIFNEIQTIQLTPIDQSENDCMNLKVIFDLYSSKSNYSKSKPGYPDYRVIVLRYETLPSRQMIAKCYLSQKVQVPLIVVHVNEVMGLNAFIYRFSL